MNEALRKLESILANAAATPQRFAPNSRYNGVPTLQLTTPVGRTVAYLSRRFIPQPEHYRQIREHRIVQGDRLDLLASQYIGDPEQWWKIADANPTLRPDYLTETPGLLLSIALPNDRAEGTGGA